MLADYHVHSNFSYDCKTPVGDTLAAFEAQGFDEICFTDHCEFPRHVEHIADFPGLYALIDALDSPVRVKKGVEVTMYDDALSEREIAERLAGLSPDFILGSVHEFGDIDPAAPGYFEEHGADRAETIYLEQVLRCVRRHAFFSALSHIDYMQKFTYSKEVLLRYSIAPDVMDEIFKALIGRGAGLELNVSSYRRLDAPAMDVSWLARYRELGGEVLTMGSDCHTPRNAGKGIKEAQAFAREAGFRYFTTFDRLRPVFHPL